ncbi:hypothetical protein ACWA1B_18930, partial [Flavobacterium sp. 3-210]
AVENTINLLDLVGDAETQTTLVYDPGAKTLTYNGENGTPTVIQLVDLVGASETVTTLANNNNGTYLYTSEDKTPTTIDVVGDVVNNASTIVNSSNFVTELTNVIKNEETLTKLVYDQAGNTLKYTDENAVENTINLLDLVGDAETQTTLVYDPSAKTLTYNGENGTSTVIQLVDLVGASETVTTLANNNNGTYLYTSEDKTPTTIDVVGDVVNNASTIVNSSNFVTELTNVIKNKETLTSLVDIVTQETDSNGQVFDKHTLTYTDETNTPNPIDLSLLVKGTETLTSLVYDGAYQSLIYKDEKGNSSEFKLVDLVGDSETLTKLEVNSANGTLDYTDEDKQLKSLDLSSAVKEPWFSTVTNVGATLNTDNIYTKGWVGIGYTTPSNAPNEKLRVNGSITTVNTYYADYVFEDYFEGFSKIKADYKFKQLSEIEDYIKKNKHLPGITPINELEKTKEGYSFNMSALSIQLLEKTEEIYLHIIEQNNINEKQSKEIEAKDKMINELKNASDAMNDRLQKLEKIIGEKLN